MSNLIIFLSMVFVEIIILIITYFTLVQVLNKNKRRLWVVLAILVVAFSLSILIWFGRGDNWKSTEGVVVPVSSSPAQGYKTQVLEDSKLVIPTDKELQEKRILLNLEKSKKQKALADQEMKYFLETIIERDNKSAQSPAEGDQE